MQSNTTKAAGEATTTKSVIINIARQIGEADDRRDEYDDQIAALRDELSQHKATTIEEAAVQMCDLTNRLGFVLEHLPQEEEADVTEQDRAAIMRLAFSVLDVLAQATGQKSETIIHDGFSDQHLNPWNTAG